MSKKCTIVTDFSWLCICYYATTNALSTDKNSDKRTVCCVLSFGCYALATVVFTSTVSFQPLDKGNFIDKN